MARRAFGTAGWPTEDPEILEALNAARALPQDESDEEDVPRHPHIDAIRDLDEWADADETPEWLLSEGGDMLNEVTGQIEELVLASHSSPEAAPRRTPAAAANQKFATARTVYPRRRAYLCTTL